MIIRIMGEGQFRINSSLFDALNEVDDGIVTAVEKDNEVDYSRGLSTLIGTIKQNGVPVGPEELVESDIIVPPADLTLEEARNVFTGSGIFKE